MGKKYTDKKKDEMICSMFSLISKSHFGDHKMGRYYCTEVSFKRSLGDDIAGFVRSRYPEVYKKEEKTYNKEDIEL
ncbi:MAG: hypothetical protein ACR2PH_11625 [Desulfobulbia bacterium]